MDIFEQKKKAVELLRVKAARMDLELQIMIRQQDIDRMNDSIKIQLEKEKELEELLK